MKETFWLQLRQKVLTFLKQTILWILLVLVLNLVIGVPVLGAVTPNGAIADERMIKVHNRLRLNKDAIRKTIDYHKDYHFKPVWDGTDKNLNEIEAFRVEMDIPKDKTFIMPAGDTRETLVKMYPLVFELCAEKGYNMTGRDHIIAYDTERGV